MSTSSRSLLWLAVALLGGVVIAGVIGLERYRETPLITMVHVPEVYPKRSGSLSANATAYVAPRARNIRYRVNEHAWRQVDDIWSSRFVGGVMTFEMPSEELEAGPNRLEISAEAPLREPDKREVSFSYDPSAVVLPLRRNWLGEPLEAQDGAWEAIEVDGEGRVRPVPGYEGYDRLLLVTGAFPAPRRIETYAVYRHERRTPREEVGFGVLSLWAGHPGSWSYLPRKGWSFALGLYWSKPGGVGSEISHYEGDAPPRWVNSYRDTPLVSGERYFIVIEVEEERAGGQHRFYRQRMKMWLESQPEPEEWIVLTDKEGARLPDSEYAVALYALDCQVEFGPITVLPLPSTDENTAPR